MTPSTATAMSTTLSHTLAALPRLAGMLVDSPIKVQTLGFCKLTEPKYRFTLWPFSLREQRGPPSPLLPSAVEAGRVPGRLFVWACGAASRVAGQKLILSETDCREIC